MPTMKHRYGFTVAEILIVLVVVGILIAVTSVGLNRQQLNARDANRSSKATSITEALEKYYDKNGEYPGCLAMTATPQTIQTSTLEGIDQEVFATPNAPNATKNSIKCSDLAPSATDDSFAYLGDSSQACATGTACSQWTFKYRKESTGDIASIQSRRKVVVAPSTVTVTVLQCSMTGIRATWTALAGTSYYQIHVSTSPTFQTVAVSSTNGPATTTFTTNSLIHNTTYYVRVLPFISAAQPTEWSPVKTVTISGTGAGTCT